MTDGRSCQPLTGTSPVGAGQVRPQRLPVAFFARDSTVVAPELLGKRFVVGRCHGRITEVEAYTQDDPASHAFRGPTPRNDVMFGPPGRLYVYFTYGMHHCVNIVTGRRGDGQAVLLRGLKPLAGLAGMRARRGPVPDARLADGPGKLAQAFEITLGLSDIDMTVEGPLWLGRIDRPAGEIGVSVRIGITKEADRPLRFYELGSKFVSGRRALNV